MKLADWTRRLPWEMAVAALLLAVIGLAGIARCEQLADTSGRLLRQQAVWVVLAGMVMLLATVPNYRVFARWGYLIFVVSLALLVGVYFCEPIHGARRWIRLGPIGVQPSELAKIAYVVMLARYLMYRENFRRPLGLLVPAGLTIVPVVLVLREPDLGTALVFLPVFFTMLFVASARLKDLGLIVLLGVLVLPGLWTQMSTEQKSRVTALFHQPGPAETVDDDAYHLRQAKQMVALGGVWGSFWQGPAVNDRAVYRLPEAHSDFIFCVLGERFGLPGMALVLALYASIVWRGVAVALATQEPFGRLLAAGLVTLLGVEVLINTAMTVGLLPITGLSLPLVSYGGSGMVTHGLLLGLLLNVGLRPGHEVAPEPFRYEVAGASRR